MPDININDIAALAHLDLTAEEATGLQHDLEAILRYVARLSQTPTEGIAPMAQPLAPDTPLREDRARVWFTPAQALANAPAARDGMFEVPKIIDRG
ncbi:MAG TPA: Asp-tRNA(Asn)/Glu-tRNA(Gln) amidotransferase subunit GatC [Terriglobales bacterium]|nr:Asp-tRNA(Asn)/Glu-tRNA(Gln) amidotransferase subunit GatC [Terriglobales bacterium]